MPVYEQDFKSQLDMIYWFLADTQPIAWCSMEVFGLFLWIFKRRHIGTWKCKCQSAFRELYRANST